MRQHAHLSDYQLLIEARIHPKVCLCIDDYLQRDTDVESCCLKLLESPLYDKYGDRVRRYFIQEAISNPDNATRYILFSLLLFDGRNRHAAFKALKGANVFLVLIEIVWKKYEEDFRLHRLGLEMLYEMCRTQKLSRHELETIDPNLITFLFELTEHSNTSEPYAQAIAKVLLVFNEQYMIASLPPPKDSPRTPSQASNPPIKNKIMLILSEKGSSCRSFGEVVIFMLNRQRETCVQLLILKLLYLLFITPRTYEYIYTNDLRVLVDVFIRELSDLPDEAEALRHTYLRVLHPLLSHTQLRIAPHYKRDALCKLLHGLKGGECWAVKKPSPTTLRLVERCLKVGWIQGLQDDSPAMKYLGVSHLSETGSNVSLVSVTQTPKPPAGVQTPLKNRESVTGAGGVIAQA